MTKAVQFTIYSSNCRAKVIRRNRNRGKQSLLISMGFFPWPVGRCILNCFLSVDKFLCFHVISISSKVRNPITLWAFMFISYKTSKYFYILAKLRLDSVLRCLRYVKRGHFSQMASKRLSRTMKRVMITCHWFLPIWSLDGLGG